MKNQIAKGSYLAPMTEVINVRLERGLLVDSIIVPGAPSGTNQDYIEDTI